MHYTKRTKQKTKFHAFRKLTKFNASIYVFNQRISCTKKYIFERDTNQSSYKKSNVMHSCTLT